MDEGDDVTQSDDDDSDEGDGDVDWLSVLLLWWWCWWCWLNCEPFDCVPVGTLLILVKNFAIGLCLDLLLIDETTVLAPAEIVVIGRFKSDVGVTVVAIAAAVVGVGVAATAAEATAVAVFNFITDVFNFCTGKLISSAVLFGGARI